MKHIRVIPILLMTWILGGLSCSPSKADPVRSSQDLRSSTKLFDAISQGDLQQVTHMLANNAVLENRDENGYTTLHWAVLTGQKTLVELLLSRGAQVNTSQKEGFTPLHDAAYAGNRAMVELLIQHGSRIYDEEHTHKAPFYLAMKNGHKEILPLLKPLHMACEQGDFTTVEKISLQEPQALTIPDEKGCYPLHLAAQSGHTQIVKLLLSRGAHLNQRGPLGATALSLAREAGQIDVVEFLSAHSALDQSDGLLLKSPLQPGQAIIWHLGSTGWAIKTQHHILIYDWELPREQPANQAYSLPTLSSGRLDPPQLHDHSVIVLSSFIRNSEHMEALQAWKKDIPRIRFLIGNPLYQRPEATYIPPYQRGRIGEGQILTTRTTGFGEGFLVKLDGLTIYFGGDSEATAESWLLFQKEIDVLVREKVQIDLLFLQMIFQAQAQSEKGVLYALQALKPALFIPSSAVANEGFFPDFLQKVQDMKLKTLIWSASAPGDGGRLHKGSGRTTIDPF